MLTLAFLTHAVVAVIASLPGILAALSALKQSKATQDAHYTLANKLQVVSSVVSQVADTVNAINQPQPDQQQPPAVPGQP